MSNTRIAIIGGGYAGMSAAVELARAEIDVTVFEAATVLGGRARVLEAEGLRLGNGQHILLGSYVETMRLLRSLRVNPKTLRTFPYLLSVPDQLRIEASSLPAPFHLIATLLKSKGLSWADRFAALRLMRHLRKLRYTFQHDHTVSQLLADTRQTPLLIELVWEPLCLAMLTTPADRASAQSFAYALREALSSAPSSAEILIPRIDMTELLPFPAALLVNRAGNPVRTATRITRIRLESGRFCLNGDEAEGSHFSHVIVATPPDSASALLAELDELTLLRAQLDKIEFEAITTIHLAYDEHITLPDPVVQVRGSPVHSLFDSGQISGKAGVITGVIRGNKAHGGMSEELLVLEVHNAVEQLNPRLPTPRWSKVVREDKAAFASTPGLVRPRALTPIHNLLLAGDYVESGFPASIESAVRSGLTTARHVIRSVRAD